MSKAGFAMLFLGMLCCCALIASFIRANVGGKWPLPPPLGEQLPTVAIGGVANVFLLIGVTCAVHWPVKFYDWAGSLVSLDIGWGAVMLILGFISIIAATVMAYVGIDADGPAVTAAAPDAPIGAISYADAPSADAEASVDLEAPAAEPPVDVEAEPTAVVAEPDTDAQPEGAVYQKNGIPTCLPTVLRCIVVSLELDLT